MKTNSYLHGKWRMNSRTSMAQREYVIRSTFYVFDIDYQSGVHHALNPDPYRGLFGSDGEKYAKEVEDLIQFGTSGHVAAFISEAIQGVGGIVELAPGYLPTVYSSIKKAGGICIADEVQSGFARTGSHFWGFESHGVVPDMVTMAKGIGNGIPLGAVVTTPKIAEVLTCRSYFNTFGGNPVCTAAGLVVLKVIDRQNLQENAHVVGSSLKDRLKALKDKHEIIGDVRGRGLMLGVELVTNRQLKTPAKIEILQVTNQMKDMGVLVGKGGFYGNVFRITPLCFSRDDAEGKIVPDPNAFPSGMKALADYIHSKGLKIGIYSDAGLYMCELRPGSLKHEYDDATLFASWEACPTIKNILLWDSEGKRVAVKYKINQQGESCGDNSWRKETR